MKLSRHSAQKSSLRSALHVGCGLQLLAVLLLLLLGQSVLGLSDFEFAFTEQSDETDSEIGSSEVESEILADFGALGVLGSAHVSFRVCSSLHQRRKWGLGLALRHWDRLTHWLHVS